MKVEKQQERISRRGFLRAAGLGAGAAAGAAVAAIGSDARSATSEAKHRPAAGYRETEHVRRAYELARF